LRAAVIGRDRPGAAASVAARAAGGVTARAAAGRRRRTARLAGGPALRLARSLPLLARGLPLRLAGSLA
jgi:hypothetical protein